MSVFSKFERIVDEVGQDLADPDRIAFDFLRRIRGDIGGEIYILRCSAFPEQADHVIENVGRAHGNRFKIETSRFDFRKVENVIDDRQQALA